MPSKKIIMLGDCGVGKTALIEKICRESFKKEYDRTIGPELHPMNIGDSIVYMWDISGADIYAYLRKDYCYKKLDAAVIMFDLTNNFSYQSVMKWHKEVRDIFPNIPIVVIGNKSDDTERRKVSMFKYDLPYFELSVKNDDNTNLLKPLNWILTQLN